eukprot:TRINITY_DN4265_c0_g1_i2.p1 TRINITY_DN4265_c0_g1~~TRINITY_DN4265_c0_g1_i2.p1  ORF type:complete len:1163 (-),score=281.05 TRINITY_DN4265_c0_g1_i2:69-3353(-)
MAECINFHINTIKEDLKSGNVARKALAVEKLVSLQLYGFSMDWAAFHIVEVMSSNTYSYKRIGYLAASQSFSDDTNVNVLTVNLLKRDFLCKSHFETGFALSCFARICTPDLAKDLAADLLPLLNNSRAYVRRRAILALYNMFLKFPEALRPSFPRLKERLSDPDQGVIFAAVSVICELARKNPKNYIALAPLFFELLNCTTHNTMLVKIIKLFGTLVTLDARFCKVLAEPMHRIITSNASAAVTYEAIRTCIIGLHDHLPTMKLCVEKLRSFVDDPDPNLKYLGLLSLHEIQRVHQKAVAATVGRELILTCLDDEDASIRSRALALMSGVASKKNLKDLLNHLSSLLEKGAEGEDLRFQDDVIAAAVDMCSREHYANLTDFEWYLEMLCRFAQMPGTRHGAMIASQLLDVLVRVPVVRPFGVEFVLALLKDPKLQSTATAGGGGCEVVTAATWIVGEMNQFLESPPLLVFDILTQPHVATLPAHVQATFLHAAMKILFAYLSGRKSCEKVEDAEYELLPLQDAVKSVDIAYARLPLFAKSNHLEVQERACLFLELIHMYRERLGEPTASSGGVSDIITTSEVTPGTTATTFVPEEASLVARQLLAACSEVLLPVAAAAQRKVKVPEGLDLDKVLNEQAAVELADTSDVCVKFLEDENSSPFEEMSEHGESTLAKEDTQAAAAATDLPVQQSGRHHKHHHKHYTVGTEEVRPEGAELADDTAPNMGVSDEDRLAAVSLASPAEKQARAAKLIEQRQQQLAAVPARPGTDLNPSPYILGSGPASTTLVVLKATESAPSLESKLLRLPLIDGNVKLLASDANLAVSYEIKTSAEEKDRFAVKLLMQNKSKHRIGQFGFLIGVEKDKTRPSLPEKETGEQPQLIDHPALTRGDYVLRAGETRTHDLLFTSAKSLSAPQLLCGHITYTKRRAANGSAEKSAEMRRLRIRFQLRVPCSAFIEEVPLNKAQLAAVVRGKSIGVASTTVPVTGDVATMTRRIASLLHLAPVQSCDNRVFYGTNFRGVHIAVLLKEKDEGKTLGIDLKCSDSTCAAALIAEVTELAAPPVSAAPALDSGAPSALASVSASAAAPPAPQTQLL